MLFIDNKGPIKKPIKKTEFVPKPRPPGMSFNTILGGDSADAKNDPMKIFFKLTA